jgi:adenine-specific DNA-methyltransferase
MFCPIWYWRYIVSPLRRMVLETTKRSTRRSIQSRYGTVSRQKADGATYTPSVLADFVARQVCKVAESLISTTGVLRILDPAIGHGQLLLSLVGELTAIRRDLRITACGFETDERALQTASRNLGEHFPFVEIDFRQRSFLDFVLEHCPPTGRESLFAPIRKESYDLVIANPPYVRTQVLGASAAQRLAETFDLTGRIDLYYPFILGIAQVLRSDGVAGIIVSNRFLTTKSGEAIRRAISSKFNIHHIWDLGDTKLFQAAVLPAVLILGGRDAKTTHSPAFSSIYLTDSSGEREASNAINALSHEGVVGLPDGRHFRVQHGKLSGGKSFGGPWRIATPAGDSWLATVDAHTWGTFGDIGKIRVGVKTCADDVFIRYDWTAACGGAEPELLRPLITHHVSRRFKSSHAERPRMILYPHETTDGRKRAVNLAKYPISQTYLEKYRPILEARTYVLEAGRQWYEIWVPQDPSAWDRPKLVFRDIADRPTFWLDVEHSVVNGDCYWIAAFDSNKVDLLWLAAAVGNSGFAEAFYDHRFHNKLYAGRRRFMTQYVEQFPLPDPQSAVAQNLIQRAKDIYHLLPSPEAQHLENELNAFVWEAFGLGLEEVRR